MTNDELRAWRQRVGLSMHDAAERLGISVRTLEGYIRHKNPKTVPRPIEMLTQYIEASLHQPST